MIELVHALLTVLGFLGARVADPGPICAGGACPEVPHRPVVAWAAPQTVRADEVRLFAWGDRKPGQPTPVPGASPVIEGERAVWVLGPAQERLQVVLRRAEAPDPQPERRDPRAAVHGIRAANRP